MPSDEDQGPAVPAGMLPSAAASLNRSAACPNQGICTSMRRPAVRRAALSARRRMSCPAARAMGSCERILASVTADYKPRVVKPYAL